MMDRGRVCRCCVRRWLRLGGSSWCFVGLLMLGSLWVCGGHRGWMISRTVCNGLLVMSDCSCMVSDGGLVVSGGSFLLSGGLKGCWRGFVVRSVEVLEFWCVNTDRSDVVGVSLVNCDSCAVL